MGIMLNGLDLFSGIGGLSLALSEWVRPVAYCEIDPYCQAVLLSRMATGNLRTSPIWDDITTLDGSEFETEIDVIYGGFPCQDISIAGHGKGLEGERSGLFFEIVRLAKEIKPSFIFLENVPAITVRGGIRVVRKIAEMGYECRWCVISAASVGALHRRERWFLLAHAQHNGASTNSTGGSFGECAASGQGSQEQAESIRETERAGCLSSDVAHSSSKSANRYSERTKSQYSLFRNCCKNVCNSDSQSSEQANSCAESIQNKQHSWRGFTGQCWPYGCPSDWQKTVSEMGKLSDGISNHVDRLRALGNAVVPAQAKEAFKILVGIK